jgi:DnaJ-like protein
MKSDQEISEESYAQDRLNKWQTYIDEKVRGWLGDGDMSWHPKAGQPLDLDGDEYIPENMRLTYKIMQDNNAVPQWMALGFSLRDKHRKIMRKVQQYSKDFVRRKQEALATGRFIRLQEIEKRWQEARTGLYQEIGRYNSELLDYNLGVPDVIGQMVPLNADALIEQALERVESASD